MNLSYDKEADAMSIKLRERKGHYDRTEEMIDGVLLDYDAQGQVLTVEILDVSSYVNMETEPWLHGVDLDSLIIQLESIGNNKAAIPFVAELVRRAFEHQREHA